MTDPQVARDVKRIASDGLSIRSDPTDDDNTLDRKGNSSFQQDQEIIHVPVDVESGAAPQFAPPTRRPPPQVGNYSRPNVHVG